MTYPPKDYYKSAEFKRSQRTAIYIVAGMVGIFLILLLGAAIA